MSKIYSHLFVLLPRSQNKQPNIQKHELAHRCTATCQIAKKPGNPGKTKRARRDKLPVDALPCGKNDAKEKAAATIKVERLAV